MSHSFSDNNFNGRDHHGPNACVFGYDDAGSQFQNVVDPLPLVPHRGRVTARASSPSKTLENVKENDSPENSRVKENCTDRSRTSPLKRFRSPAKQYRKGDASSEEEQLISPPPSPTKRSRSPMKQLFGERGILGRSISLKELESDEQRKKGMKNWGGKIIQRVGGMVMHIRINNLPSLMLTRE